MDNKKVMKKRRHMRIRVKVSGTKDKPRLSIFRSNKYIYAQVIDDNAGTTLVAVSDFKLQKSDKKKTKTERAGEVGSLIAKTAKDKKIKTVVLIVAGFVIQVELQR